MAKRRGPALYELVRVRQRGGPFSEGQPQYTAKDEEHEPSEGAWWKGSRIIRLPVGYVFLAIGLGIALMFAGYFVGYGVRDREIRDQDAQTARADLEGITDPTLRNVPESSGLIDGLSEGEEPSGAPERPSVSAQPRPNPFIVDDWIDDPRTSGMNYFIVATQPPTEAGEAAEFLAARGLKSHAFLWIIVGSPLWSCWSPSPPERWAQRGPVSSRRGSSVWVGSTGATRVGGRTSSPRT